MKWIKSRDIFLNEAKIRDIVLPKQKEFISKKWGEKYLDYEEVTPTENIQQGKWKLSDKDKNKVLSEFFYANIDLIYERFKDLPEKFVEVAKKSIELAIESGQLGEKYKVIFEDWDPVSPTIDQLSCLYDNIFKKLAINDTKGTSIIKKDQNGRPIKDNDGKMIKIEKKAGDPIFDNNFVSIKNFTESYNSCYPDKVNEDVFYNEDLKSLVSLSKENHNSRYKIDFKIFDRDLYLYIQHNPRHILNMSISKFFSSCQHLYTGSYNECVLGNVFDPNSIPAYLIFETPIYNDNDELIGDFLPLCRMMIRSIDDENGDERGLFFDRCYPDRLDKKFKKIIESYTDNKHSDKLITYVYTPDICLTDNIADPYMDRLNFKEKRIIGKNTKILHLNRGIDWENIKMSPEANIKELVIDTEELPTGFDKMNINADWVKFRFMKINNLNPFSDIITNSLSFDKCYLLDNIFSVVPKSVKKLRFLSTDIKPELLDLSNFKDLTELHLIYTLDNFDELKTIIENNKDNKLEKLVISGDLFSTKESKEYLKELKKNKKIEIEGPIL